MGDHPEVIAEGIKEAQAQDLVKDGVMTAGGAMRLFLFFLEASAEFFKVSSHTWAFHRHLPLIITEYYRRCAMHEERTLRTIKTGTLYVMFTLSHSFMDNSVPESNYKSTPDLFREF